MKQISNIEEADEYIFNYDFFQNLSGNKEELAVHLETCESLALRHGHDKLLCRARTYLIYLFIEENNLNKAAELAAVNLQYAKEKELNDELLYMISIVANLYQLTGNFSASEELIQIALDALAFIKDDLKIAKIYLMLAEQYFFTSNQAKCMDAYQRSISHSLKAQDHSLTAICHANFADRLLQYQMLEQLPIILDKGMEYALKINNTFIEAQLNEKYGAYYILCKDFTNATSYLLNSAAYYRSTNNTRREIGLYPDLVRIYIEEKELKKAEDLLAELESKALDSKASKILLDAYLLYVDLYEAENKFQEALLYLKKYNELNARIYNEESDEKIRNLQIQYEVKTIQLERDSATKLARIKHDFLANMSHEIRTPINSILGICYLLQQDSLSPKQEDYIYRLNHSGEQLLGIINDVLDISKIEAGKFQLVSAPYRIRKLMSGIYDSLSIKSSDKRLEFKLDIEEQVPEVLTGDVTRLGQILINLVYNAIKFTHSGHILVSVKTVSISDNTALIQFDIEDTGIGMTSEQLEKIFNEYEQAEQNTQVKFGGTGLGLSISKKLIELMSGTINVKSKKDIGTTFSFQIPFTISSGSSAPKENESFSCELLTDKLIYIADDIEENRKVMAELLYSLNQDIQTRFATNGKELLEMVALKIPDIIMMDLDMPEINGFDAASILQKDYPSHDIKTIACTASLLTMPREELMEHGFSNLLLKPFSVKQLVEVLI